ncbi:hypothetical protein LTR94_031311, partial [Friedmanniomyces endolithicus]
IALRWGTPDRSSFAPETSGISPHVSGRREPLDLSATPVRHIELLAPERRQNLDNRAAGKAFEQKGTPTAPHRQARRAILMGRASAHAPPFGPDAPEPPDNVLSGCCHVSAHGKLRASAVRMFERA